MVANIPGVFFGIPVSHEEATGVVDQKFVEFGCNLTFHTKPGRRTLRQASQGLWPAPSSHHDLVRADLPGFTHAWIEHGLLAFAVRRGSGYGDQPLGLVRHYWKREPTDTVHVNDGHGNI